MNPVEMLRAGAAELADVLGPLGFQFIETGSGLGSGGHVADAESRQRIADKWKS